MKQNRSDLQFTTNQHSSKSLLGESLFGIDLLKTNCIDNHNIMIKIT